ncbi:hypothetical protein [Lentzea sp. NPDC004782]|uniref:hypothetical protein n=1 Tax=Lentzea sp. NPDC004782 TaxID=3154458 RepID=UPI0033A9FBEC
MTRRTALPTRDEIQVAISHLAEAAGKPPTVLALARHLGLANTTFRRSFPGIATELNQHRSQPSPHDPAAVSQFAQLKRDNDNLRQDNHELRQHLELAISNIQRLTLDNHQLRQNLEAAVKVRRLDGRHP